MNRRKHTNEFKMEAVRMAQRGDVAITQVARDLGIHDKMDQSVRQKSGRLSSN